jgi:hypothetical protein
MAKKQDIKITPEPAKMLITFSNVTVKTESNYFFISRRKKCTEFLKINDPKESDILEFLLNLHFVLEIGVNTFFRNYYKCLTNYDFINGSKEIDNISFSDKVTIFLNENRFNLRTGEDLKTNRDKVSKIIKRIKDFNYIRNMIVHGHPINEISSGEYKNQSELKSKLNKVFYTKQIENFKEIISNINYFVDRIETTIRRDTIEMFQKIYLNLDFLDIKK